MTIDRAVKKLKQEGFSEFYSPDDKGLNAREPGSPYFFHISLDNFDEIMAVSIVEYDRKKWKSLGPPPVKGGSYLSTLKKALENYDRLLETGKADWELLGTAGDIEGIIRIIGKFFVSDIDDIELVQVDKVIWKIEKRGKELKEFRVTKKGKKYRFEALL